MKKLKNILISGEPGSGKSILAKELTERLSKRRRTKVIHVNDQLLNFGNQFDFVDADYSVIVVIDNIEKISRLGKYRSMLNDTYIAHKQGFKPIKYSPLFIYVLNFPLTDNHIKRSDFIGDFLRNNLYRITPQTSKDDIDDVFDIINGQMISQRLRIFNMHH